MKKVSRIGKGLLPVLVLGLAVGALLSFGCSDDKIVTNTVEVEVPEVNNAPVLAEIGAQAVDLGGPMTIVVTASDLDGDTLSYLVLNLPPGATFDAATQTFSWTPEPGVTPAGDYENVIFIVYDDKESGDSETITITVTAVAAAGANYTGKYIGIASNFPTGDGLCSSETVFIEPNEDLCYWGIPQPGCEEITPPGFLVQSDDDAIFYMAWLGVPFGFTGTVKNDGSFAMDDTISIPFLSGTATMVMALTGKISADKTEISMDIDLDFGEELVQCEVGFDFIGPGLDNSNATITLNGFTQTGVNVYAFVDPSVEPTAIGGGTIGDDGSAEIQLRPMLSEGECFEVAVWLDIDAGDESIMDCWENEQFICDDDLCAGEEICIDEGSGTLELDPGDFSEGGCF